MNKRMTMTDGANGTEVEVVGAQDVTARVDRIRSYHAGFLRSFRDQMGFAFLAGVELLALKETVRHGEFTVYREEHLADISNGSTHRYMVFAETLISKFPTVGNLLGASNSPLGSTLLLGPGGGLADEAQTAVLEAVHEIADGRTLTEMYRDLGVIRQPKAKEYHPPKLTSKELAAAEKRGAEELWRGWINRTRWLLEDTVTMGLISDDMFEEADGLRIDLGKLMAEVKRARK